MIRFEQIQALGERIAREFSPVSVVLFGSYAYGEPDESSDVDLLVVLPFEGRPSRKALEILQRVDSELPLDLIVRTPDHVKHRLLNGDCTMRDILLKGRKLYESDHQRMG